MSVAGRFLFFFLFPSSGSTQPFSPPITPPVSSSIMEWDDGTIMEWSDSAMTDMEWSGN